MTVYRRLVWASLAALLGCAGDERSTPVRPDAFLSWQDPEGIAGTGPAITVSGNGTVHLWGVHTAFDPANPPADHDATLTLDTTATDDLFERFAQTSLTSLPHA